MAFIRLWLFLLAGQIILYILLRLSLRRARAERLEGQWNARHPGQERNTDLRDAFVTKAMTGFDRTLRMRLTVLVLILPTLAVFGIVYLVNWQ